MLGTAGNSRHRRQLDSRLAVSLSRDTTMMTSEWASMSDRRRKDKPTQRIPHQTRILIDSRAHHEKRLKYVAARLRKAKSRDVFLKVYDITDGRASQWLKPLLGAQIDGIWHTGLICFKKEHFYCDGIQSMSPQVVELKYTMSLKDIFYLGKTHLSKKQFSRYLDAHRDLFAPEKYDLIEWNCNHFTDMAVKKLFPDPRSTWIQDRRGSSWPRLPTYVTEQPNIFMSTVRGRLLVWMTKNVLEKVDNFLNANFAAGLDQIIERWFPKK